MAARRNKNAYIDASVNLLGASQQPAPKRKKKKVAPNHDPLIERAVLNVGLPVGQPPTTATATATHATSNASTVSLPLPPSSSSRRDHHVAIPASNPLTHSRASQSTTSLPIRNAAHVQETTSSRPRQMVRQQSNSSTILPETQVTQAEAEIRAAMNRHDVYEGLDVQVEAEPPPEFTAGEAPPAHSGPVAEAVPTSNEQSHSIPASPPPTYISRPASPASIHSDASSVSNLPLFPLKPGFTIDQIQERMEDLASIAWNRDLLDGISLVERVERDQMRRREMGRMQTTTPMVDEVLLSPSEPAMIDSSTIVMQEQVIPSTSTEFQEPVPIQKPALHTRSQSESMINLVSTSSKAVDHTTPIYSLLLSQDDSEDEEDEEIRRRNIVIPDLTPRQKVPPNVDKVEHASKSLASAIEESVPSLNQAGEVENSVQTPAIIEDTISAANAIVQQQEETIELPSERATTSNEFRDPLPEPLALPPSLAEGTASIGEQESTTSSSNPFTTKLFGPRLKRNSKVFTSRPASLTKRSSGPDWTPFTIRLAHSSSTPHLSNSAPPSPSFSLESSSNTPDVHRVKETASEKVGFQTAESGLELHSNSSGAGLQPIPGVSEEVSARPKASLSGLADRISKAAQPIIRHAQSIPDFPLSETSLPTVPQRIATFHTGEPVAAVTVWDPPESATDELQEQSISRAPAVQKWDSHSNRFSSVDFSSATEEETRQKRREEARRHSALLVRPLSIKRKPPVPTPRRWATAIKRTSTDLSSVQEDSSSETFSPKIKPELPPPSILSYISPDEAGGLPEPLSPSNASVFIPSKEEGGLRVPPLRPMPMRSVLRPPMVTPDPPAGAFRIPRRLPVPPNQSPSDQALDAHSQLQIHEKRQARFFPPSPNPSDITERAEGEVWTSSSSSGGSVTSSEAGSVSRRTDPLPQVPSRALPSVPPSRPEQVNEDEPLVHRAPLDRPQRQRSLYYTDFDALVARVNRNEENDGTTYDDLLMIAEVLGSAKPAPSSQMDRDLDQIVIAKIELESRRVDKSGKTKSKYTCGGVRVNKCAICLVQFRPENMACIFPECLHVFHADCMRKWLLRSRLCPTCRQPLPN